MSLDRFHENYASGDPEQLPWYHPHPDPDVVALFDAVARPGQRSLDLGAGPAVHSIELARRGLKASAIDGVDQARSVALRLAAKAGVELDYRVQDVLGADSGLRAELVFDRGFMHTLTPEERPAWRAVVLRSLVPGGHLVLKGFDRLPVRGFGPRGLDPAELIEALGDPAELTLLSLTRSTFPTHDADDHATWTLLARRN